MKKIYRILKKFYRIMKKFYRIMKVSKCKPASPSQLRCAPLSLRDIPLCEGDKPPSAHGLPRSPVCSV